MGKSSSKQVSHGSSTQSSDMCGSSRTLGSADQWVERVHAVQCQRMTPEARDSLLRNVEAARLREVSLQRCKAVQRHSRMSCSLAHESLRQMSISATAEDFGAAQGRWRSAQEASANRLRRASMPALLSTSTVAEVVNEDALEAEAVAEVAELVGAADVTALAAEAATVCDAPEGSVHALLQQLQTEPEDAAVCAAKFALYEGYAVEVESIRGSLLSFHEESTATVPAAVADYMKKQVNSIDSAQAMGVPDDVNVWFVYHMMRQAERNNRQMAGLLKDFERKLELLSAHDQTDCPVCLETFEVHGSGAAETLGCCHKVCRSCWERWTTVMDGCPFCPLCRQDDFLGIVARRATQAPH